MIYVWAALAELEDLQLEMFASLVYWIWRSWCLTVYVGVKTTGRDTLARTKCNRWANQPLLRAHTTQAACWSPLPAGCYIVAEL